MEEAVGGLLSIIKKAYAVNPKLTFQVFIHKVRAVNNQHLAISWRLDAAVGTCKKRNDRSRCLCCFESRGRTKPARGPSVGIRGHQVPGLPLL